jgi:hypothetical protein
MNVSDDSSLLSGAGDTSHNGGDTSCIGSESGGTFTLMADRGEGEGDGEESTGGDTAETGDSWSPYSSSPSLSSSASHCRFATILVHLARGVVNVGG